MWLWCHHNAAWLITIATSRPADNLLQEQSWRADKKQPQPQPQPNYLQGRRHIARPQACFPCFASLSAPQVFCQTLHTSGQKPLSSSVTNLIRIVCVLVHNLHASHSLHIQELRISCRKCEQGLLPIIARCWCDRKLCFVSTQHTCISRCD